MLANAYRTYPGTTTAVWDTEGFMQVQMRYVAAKFTRCANADHCIHIGAVDINLTTVGMDQFAHVGNVFFENPVRGRVGDHDGSQFIAMLLGLGF